MPSTTSEISILDNSAVVKYTLRNDSKQHIPKQIINIIISTYLRENGDSVIGEICGLEQGWGAPRLL